MKPQNFNECNAIFGDMPSLLIGEEKQQATFLYKLKFKERIQLLVKGKLWLSQKLIEKGKLAPMLISTEQKEHFVMQPNKMKVVKEEKK